MKLHELKYEVRKRRVKPEGEAEKKLYNIITDSRFTVSLYDIHHMRVLKNGTVAQCASTFRNIIIWIETDTLQMPGFPARFNIITLKEDFILQTTEEDMSSFLTKAIDKIFQDRIRKIIDRLMKERESRQNNHDEEINDTV